MISLDDNRESFENTVKMFFSAATVEELKTAQGVLQDMINNYNDSKETV